MDSKQFSIREGVGSIDVIEGSIKVGTICLLKSVTAKADSKKEGMKMVATGTINGLVRNIWFNKTSIRAIEKRLGTNTDKWVGMEIKVSKIDNSQFEGKSTIFWE